MSVINPDGEHAGRLDQYIILQLLGQSVNNNLGVTCI